MKLIKKLKKAITTVALSTMLLGSMPITAFAAETEDVETKVETTTEVETPEANIETTEVETTEVAETEVADETTPSTPSSSLEDLLKEEDKTANVVEENSYTALTIVAPSSIVITKDGVTLSDYNSDEMVTDGVFTLSQPTTDEYKNRIQDEVTIIVENGKVTVDWLNTKVDGTMEDELGNTVSFDGKSTIEITNSDKMEDAIPEEDDSDETITPAEGPDDFTVCYYRDALQEGNYLGSYKVKSTAGATIDYTTIDVNQYQPASYGEGKIQTVVSSKTCTSDDTDIVYILYTAVEKDVEVVTETVEVEKVVTEIVEVEKIVEKEVPVEVEKIVEKEVPVIQEVPVEKLVEVEKPIYIYVPGEDKIIETPKYIEVPGETEYVYVPGDTKYVYVPIEVPGETEIVYVPVDPETDTDNSITPEENPDPDTDEDEPINPEDGPQTGDNAMIIVFGLLALAILAGGVLVLTSDKKKN